MCQRGGRPEGSAELELYVKVVKSLVDLDEPHGVSAMPVSPSLIVPVPCGESSAFTTYATLTPLSQLQDSLRRRRATAGFYWPMPLCAEVRRPTSDSVRRPCTRRHPRHHRQPVRSRAPGWMAF